MASTSRRPRRTVSSSRHPWLRHTASEPGRRPRAPRRGRAGRGPSGTAATHRAPTGARPRGRVLWGEAPVASRTPPRLDVEGRRGGVPRRARARGVPWVWASGHPTQGAGARAPQPCARRRVYAAVRSARPLGTRAAPCARDASPLHAAPPTRRAAPPPVSSGAIPPAPNVS